MISREDALQSLSRIIDAVIQTVKEHSDGAPMGPMYAAFMAHGMSLETFEEIIKGIIDAGFLRRSGDLLFTTKSADPAYRCIGIIF